MDADDTSDGASDRRHPWRKYESLPGENSPRAETLLSFKERMATMTLSEQNDSPQQSVLLPDLRHAGLSRSVKTRRERAHMGPWWWMPEILSQIGGMLCLLGTFGGNAAPHDTD